MALTITSVRGYWAAPACWLEWLEKKKENKKNGGAAATNKSRHGPCAPSLKIRNEWTFLFRGRLFGWE